MRKALVGLLLLCAVNAFGALIGGTNVTVQNGSISVSGTIAAVNGGTGITTPLTADSVLGTGSSTSAWSQLAVPNCGDGTHALSYNTSTHVFGCQALTAGFNSTVPFSSLTALTTSQTIYVTSGNSDTQESNIQTPALNNMTIGGFSCVNQAVQGTGNNVVVTLMSGTCVTGASNLTASTRTCTLTGATSGPQTCNSINSSLAITAGQCFDWRIVTPAALTNNAFVTCSFERSA